MSFRDTLLGQLVLAAGVMIGETLKSAAAEVLIVRLKAGLEVMGVSVKSVIAEGYREYLRRGVYTPEKYDLLDIEVAKEVNAARSSAVVPMFRVKEGEYMYGTTRITISSPSAPTVTLHPNTRLSLSEYLDLYGPVEQQKVALAMDLQ